MNSNNNNVIVMTRQDVVNHALKAASERMNSLAFFSNRHNPAFDPRVAEQERVMMENMTARRLFADDDY